jgi:hypothetical protein
MIEEGGMVGNFPDSAAFPLLGFFILILAVSNVQAFRLGVGATPFRQSSPGRTLANVISAVIGVGALALGVVWAQARSARDRS